MWINLLLLELRGIANNNTLVLLGSLVQCFNDAEELICQFLDSNWFTRAVNAGTQGDYITKCHSKGTNKESFEEINTRLMKVSQDLQLGIAIQHIFSAEQDRRDEGSFVKTKA
jgi:hypothetical protein